jgi:hypothetical protein
MQTALRFIEGIKMQEKKEPFSCEKHLEYICDPNLPKDEQLDFLNIGLDMFGYHMIEELASREDVDENSGLYLSWIAAKEFMKNPEFIIY